METPAAKQGDRVIGVDTHIVMIPSPGGPVPTPVPMPFTGQLTSKLSPDVLIEHKPAATRGSLAVNAPAHVPAGGPFQRSPSNQATVKKGTSRVLINGKEAARLGDPADTCNDPATAPNGTVIGSGTVFFGG
jgi:uncharacterized Zn-binding protein involved in type VI secretion